MYLINYVVQMWIVPMPLLYCAKLASHDASKGKTNETESKQGRTCKYTRDIHSSRVYFSRGCNSEEVSNDR